MRGLGLSWRLLLASVLTGVAAGLSGVVLTVLLHAVQHVAFGYTEDTFLVGVEQARAIRRVVAVGVGGAVVGVGWWLHRRLSRSSVSVTHALAARTPRLPVLAAGADAVLQIVAVGSGASLGREGAPRRVGAALGGYLAERLALTPRQRRVILAAGAGAGLAAVYNVPLAGAAFTVEVLLASISLSAVVPAVVTAGIATVTAWPFLGDHATYQLPRVTTTAGVAVAALLLGPVGAAAGLAFRAGMTWTRTHAPRGWRAALAMPISFAALGALSITYPQLLGNGKSLAQVAFTGSLGVALAVTLVSLKPVATGACLASGAIGGLLTPSFATGAALGVAAGRMWSSFWPGGAPAAYALLGAAAILTVTQRAPLTALLLAVELTHAGPALLGPIALAVVTARFTEGCARRHVRRGVQM